MACSTRSRPDPNPNPIPNLNPDPNPNPNPSPYPNPNPNPLDKARRLGHDMSKVELVAHGGAPPPKLDLDVAATPPAASALIAKKG